MSYFGILVGLLQMKIYEISVNKLIREVVRLESQALISSYG